MEESKTVRAANRKRVYKIKLEELGIIYLKHKKGLAAFEGIMKERFIKMKDKMIEVKKKSRFCRSIVWRNKPN